MTNEELFEKVFKAEEEYVHGKHTVKEIMAYLSGVSSVMNTFGLATQYHFYCMAKYEEEEKGGE